jgi:hypothetical protein
MPIVLIAALLLLFFTERTATKAEKKGLFLRSRLNKKTFVPMELKEFKPQARPFTENEIREALQRVKSIYGETIAKNVEKIFRWETRHFDSLQFKTAFSAGMEVFSDRFPYGWTTPLSLWQRNTEFAPIGFVQMRDAVGLKRFLVFRSPLAGFMTLAEYLTKYPVGRWYSTNKDLQKKYEAKVNTIKNRFI